MNEIMCRFNKYSSWIMLLTIAIELAAGAFLQVVLINMQLPERDCVSNDLHTCQGAICINFSVNHASEGKKKHREN
jgi:hypothetical protein